jgi:hypothetical protein
VAAQGVDRGVQELSGPERLDEVAAGAELEGSLRDFRVVDPGDEHDAGLGVVVDYLPGRIQPGFAGHVNVAQRQLKRLSREPFASFGDAGRELALVSLAEGLLDQMQDLRPPVGCQDNCVGHELKELLEGRSSSFGSDGPGSHRRQKLEGTQ